MLPVLCQGAPMFHVSDSMQLSGDLVLRGLPDQPGAPGSWVLMPLIQLVGAGSLTFQVGCSSWVPGGL